MKVKFTDNVPTQDSESRAGSSEPNHRWVLSGDNGEPLSESSEGYARRIDCIHGFALTTLFDFADDWQSASRPALNGGIQIIEVEGL